VPHSEHPSMHADQRSLSQSPRHVTARKARIEELCDGRDSVLPRGDTSHLFVMWWDF